MADASPAETKYHALLVGIDSYPDGYNSLSGCVNDIDAIEELLLDAPGVGLDPDQIEITRLAASAANRPSTTRQETTLPPTKANVLQALKKLAGPEVRATDRVLIFYSGHGDEKQWKTSSVWHEALVPHNGEKIDFLYDVEINALLAAISERTDDLTVVLDCCHSYGATRSLVEPTGADRFLGSGLDPVDPPDPWDPPDLSSLGANGSNGASTGLLPALEPRYVVVVACRSDEKAGEGNWPGEPRSLGIFTYAFTELLADLDGEQRAALRWADIWPDLLATVADRCVKLRRRPQFPQIIGRSERRLFGGSWQRQDVGYRVTVQDDDTYQVGAGSLMGVTLDAEINVYGAEPLRFPPLGSAEDQPVGRLRVISADRATAMAAPVGAAFDLPQGARGRLAKAGQGQRLQIALKQTTEDVETRLAKSALLEIVPPDTPDANVEVTARLDGGWTIGNDTEPVLAVVPEENVEALAAGLEAYYGYQTVLNMAASCNDPQLTKSLDLRILDCQDTALIEGLSQEAKADPPLPELGKDAKAVYLASRKQSLAIRASNGSHEHTLNVTVLNCSAGGMVEILGFETLRPRATHVFWHPQAIGKPFTVSADPLPDSPERPPYVTDRLVAIATTRDDVDLSPLRIERRVQQVIDDLLQRTRSGDKSLLAPEESKDSAPAELWTATVTPLRIQRT